MDAQIPEAFTVSLHQLLVTLDRTERVYAAIRNDAPAVPHAAGLPQLFDLATRTRLQVQKVLDADSRKREAPKPALVPEFSMAAIPARIRAARELKASIESARRILSTKPRVFH